MLKRIVLFTVVLGVSLFTALPAVAADGNGVIEGRLINLTENGSSVSGQEVKLTTYQGESEISSTTAVTDSAGNFTFNGLATESDYSYEVLVTYQGADYQTGRLSFSADGDVLPVEIEVYDSTTSPDAIRIEQAHTIVYTDPEEIWVEEVMLFINESDRTYVGKEGVLGPGVRQTLQFSLPEDARELQPAGELMQCCVYGTEEGFSDSMPFFPGTKEIAYAYKIDYGPEVHSFAWRVNYPVKRYDLLVQGAENVINSGSLSPTQPMDISGALFSHAQGSEFAPGDTVAYEISGLPGADNQNIILWVVLVVVALGFGTGFVLVRRNRQAPPVRAGGGSLEQQQQKLMLEIARLDDAYESGGISQKAYRSQRAEKKARLLSLMQRTKGKSGRR